MNDKFMRIKRAKVSKKRACTIMANGECAHER